MSTRFTNIEALVRFARKRAERGVYTGKMTAENMRLMDVCSYHYVKPLSDNAAFLIFTRDIGHHTSGWWKNPDYERCFHLSLSQRDPDTFDSVPKSLPFFAEIAEVFFGVDARKAWLEGPYSPEGKSHDVWHYRVFCNEVWEPFLPRGEVYTKDFTEVGWRSFSEVHGLKSEEVDAPFLMEGAK